MKLLVDTRNGIAGDIICAGLIGLGADPVRMVRAMESAVHQIGQGSIIPVFANNEVSLDISLSRNHQPMSESMARGYMCNILEELGMPTYYRTIGERILDVLCQGERFVHTRDPRLKHMLVPHHHHGHQHNVDGGSSEAILHEAQDILCDIAGYVTGLQELDVDEVLYHSYVNVGNGSITFSHGTFPVPAPATRAILDNAGIPWLKSPEHNKEMATPSGASILVGSNARKITDLNGLNVIKTAHASGTRPGLPTIPFHLLH